MDLAGSQESRNKEDRFLNETADERQWAVIPETRLKLNIHSVLLLVPWVPA
jgi:hypothetical protein